ncbi:hypothetical protein AOLI_G00178200 [Acnodon oligacanthus]
MKCITPIGRAWDLARVGVFTYVAFRGAIGAESRSSRHGTGSHDQIHQPGEPGCVPPPHSGAACHWHVLHSMVLCV